MTQNFLRTYHITHGNDPRIVNDNLELGHQKCMKKLRPYAIEGDWIAAQLGKSFYEYRDGKKIYPFRDGRYDFENERYLFYAMQVSKIYELENTRILSSERGKYACFFENPIPIPKKFHWLLTKGEAPNKKSVAEAKEFIDWLKMQFSNAAPILPVKSSTCP